MKKTALTMAVVVAMLGLALLGGPALAQNHTNIVTQSTVDSTFFGFVPTQANLQTFMQSTTALSCDSITAPTSCSLTGPYVKNSQMPGSFTDRPDSGGNNLRPTERIVSAAPDFGCGVFTTDGTSIVPLSGGSACLEDTAGAAPGINLHDRVNGNVNTAGNASDGVNSGLGQNTAPSAANTNAGVNGNGVNNGTDNGTLVGTMTSNVTIGAAAEDGMPSGFINFSRSETGIVSFDQSVIQNVAGLYDFSERDCTSSGTDCSTLTTFLSGVPGAPVVNGGTGCFSSASNPCNTAGFRTSGGGPALPSYIGAGLPVIATLDISQTSMGGEGTAMDVIGPYTVRFPGNGSYPVPGQFFTPGLNVADWANTAATDTDGFPN